MKGNTAYLEDEIDFTQKQKKKPDELKYLFNVDSYIEHHCKFNKLVFACTADEEQLPFGDRAFDAYISNFQICCRGGDA